MKTILLFAVAVFLAALAMACRPSAPVMNPEIAEMLTTNAPPPGFATRLDYIKSFTSYAEIDKAYRSGKISKEEAMLADMINRVGPNDKSPMDAYGKVIDQNGQPVAGAKVHGYLSFESPDIREEHDTKTDAQGRFRFLGLHGKDLGIVPEKEGYEYNRNMGFAVLRPKNYLPDPNHPLIFTMWKLHGGEPMWHSDTMGVPSNYYILKPNGDALWSCRDAKYIGERKTPGKHHYDLEVSLKREEPIRKDNYGHRVCNWSATIEIENGGLIEIATNNPYPYEAPLDGYQQSILLNFPTNMTGWSDKFEKRFYFKSENEKAYGRMTIKLDNEGWFHGDIYINPSGSRNLEFDPSKQIWPKYY